ncbi:SMALL NUCLEAR RNA ACTIVATING COMPLEX POLYPEPTIDE 1 [Salix koriyanagi]|uniref:SMALL NUCLEAR RNA ACTIVATING COMPLEX POLYPEPTIDE 1 n=2 Tax=Salix koriyanagi TaxID=2511006 RepID=A0A9Q0VFH9_9ROSI|nr:SMALL NUCLEAR RNA ACTIVATING COMPLEX POLYPEPTIDE 1 [Salix koriyanagi]KAJ6747323.1 SMALL NUCLEAR RNA ACTIVATING COMPLEX POLYPEPTIDE 1 [Salix koriyanagi]
MDLSPFKLDIDELINEFVEGEFTTLADMKRVWLSRKFTYIFEASPPTKLAFFMQSLYAHTIGHMISTSLSQRLGGLYCLYCLYETQPFKPPFKIYLSLGELKKLKTLVINAKEHGIKVVTVLVKRMLEKNMFLFGFVDLNEGSVSETVNQLSKLQDARVQVAYKKLFDDTRIEQFLHMDMGMEFDLDMLKNMSTEYAEAKKLAIREASMAVDVQNIQHISEDREIIGDEIERITENWNVQRQVFYQQTGLNERYAKKNEQPHQPQHKKHEQKDDDVGDEFSHQLELQLIEEEQLEQKQEDDESSHGLEV